MPDLQHSINNYYEGRVPADDFVKRLGVLYEISNNTFKQKLSPFIQFPHKCMYDTPRLIEIMNSLGFEVNARGALESDIMEISDVELKQRTENAVILEGRKQ